MHDLDEGTRAALELQRSTGFKRIKMAIVPVAFAVWWISVGRSEDTLLTAGILAPAGLALLIAALIAGSGVLKVTRADELERSS